MNNNVAQVSLNTAALQSMEARAQATPLRPGETPFERAHADYQHLQKDNLEMSDELRRVTIEREVLEKLNLSLTAELERVTRKCESISSRLGSIKTLLRNGGNLLVQAIKEAENGVGEVPPEVEKYAPNPTVGDKIPTGDTTHHPNSGEQE